MTSLDNSMPMALATQPRVTFDFPSRLHLLRVYKRFRGGLHTRFLTVLWIIVLRAFAHAKQELSQLGFTFSLLLKNLNENRKQFPHQRTMKPLGIHPLLYLAQLETLEGLDIWETWLRETNIGQRNIRQYSGHAF